MNARSVFEFGDYKAYILDFAKSEGEPWGYWSRVAKGIQCQPAYLSRCLHGSTHLTVDQLLGLANYWRLSGPETEYLICIYEAEKAGQKATREYFKSRAHQLKEAQQNLKQRFRKESLEKIEEQALYYSNWWWMAIHFLTSIKKYQTVDAISKKLHLNSALVTFALEKLKSFKLVHSEKNDWKFFGGEFHLGKESTLISTHHQNWRNKAVEDSQNPLSDGIHYSAVYTMNEKTFERIKNKILQTLEETREDVTKSPEEEIFCMNFDFFRLD